VKFSRKEKNDNMYQLITCYQLITPWYQLIIPFYHLITPWFQLIPCYQLKQNATADNVMLSDDAKSLSADNKVV
jgi:hypothetical protein